MIIVRRRGHLITTLKVKIGNIYSETLNIPSDVSQKSVLGPFQFLIFMNDLTNVIKSEIELLANYVKQVV